MNIGESEEGVLAFGDTEVTSEQPGVLNNTTGEQLNVALLSSIIKLLINDSSIVNSVPDPSVLSGMLGAMELDVSRVVRVINNTLVDCELIVICPELGYVGGDISLRKLGANTLRIVGDVPVNL